jgi:hypothetical protein
LSLSWNNLLNQKALPEWIPILEILSHHGFVDDRDWRSAGDIAVAQPSSFPQPHPDRSEIRRTDHFEKAALTFGAVNQRLICDLKRHAIT